jgi:hypothetical protein
MLGGRTDTTVEADDVVRALADPERLAIAGVLARQDLDAGALAERLDLPLARVRRHLNRLVTVGLATLGQDRSTYSFRIDELRQLATAVGPPREAGLALGAANENEEAVLRTFFRRGRLTEIPSKASKRRIVLERLAVEFEPGVRYPERAVNAILGRFHPDHATLRRALVDEGFLHRDHGEYWRSGGRVEL